MKKLILLLLILFFLPACVFAFGKKEKPSLFLAPYNPLTEVGLDEKLEYNSVFRKNEKIYFLVYTPKGFSSDYIRYQIVKQDDNAHRGGYTRIRNITRRVKNKNTYVDYFVLSQCGKYIIQVFDITNLHQWIVYGEFRVVDE